jgi:hypothetical protein
VFRYERRVGQRRADRDEAGLPIDDEMIVEITIEDGPGDHAEVFEDLTMIRELVDLRAP